MSILYRVYATRDPAKYIYVREGTLPYILAWLQNIPPLYNLRVTHRGHLQVPRPDAPKVSPISKE
jgi:hypothetical protein